LRPLTLSEIFNGAIAYVRMNPKATMGITALVVVAAQILGLVIQIWSLSALGALEQTTSDPFGEGATGPSVDALIGSSLSDFAGLAANGLALIVLNGLLTVIVGRAVFGSKITIGEAWQRARGRLLPLIGLTAVQGIASVLLVVVAVVLTVLAYYAAGGGAAFGVGALLTIAVLVVLAQPVRAPVPAAPAPVPAATQQAFNDDRPPHTKDLPPARGNQVLPAPTPHLPEWEVRIPPPVSPDRLPEWEDLHPAP